MVQISGRNPDNLRRVQFEYCISLLFITLRRRSEPITIPEGRTAWVRGLPYSLISLLFGWWGIPWGILLTPVSLGVNLWGGHELGG